MSQEILPGHPPVGEDEKQIMEAAARFAELGRIVEHVSNTEAIAIAAMVHECDPDVLWMLYLAEALYFGWEEWGARDPNRRATAGAWGTVITPTYKIVQRAIGSKLPAEVLSLDGRRQSGAMVRRSTSHSP